jgi:hypothetical protein
MISYTDTGGDWGKVDEMTRTNEAKANHRRERMHSMRNSRGRNFCPRTPLHYIWPRLIALSVCFALSVSTAFPQEISGSSQLQIKILEGEGAVNNVRQRDAREPIVQIHDENHKPISGALVIFTLPDSGPSGTFVNGAKVFSVETDGAGRAAGQGLTRNEMAGNYQLRVDAQYRGNTARATIHQTNSIESTSSPSHNRKHASHRRVVIISVAVASGLVVALLIHRRKHCTDISGAPTPCY